MYYSYEILGNEIANSIFNNIFIFSLTKILLMVIIMLFAKLAFDFLKNI